MNLEQILEGIKFKGAIINASGINDTTLSELRTLAYFKCSAIATKTATYSPKEGNPEPRYFENEDYTINSMGLPNPAYAVMSERIKALKEITQKPIFGSLRLEPKKEIERYWMIKAYEQVGTDIIEVNLSTPNIIGKPQLCYDIEACDEILSHTDKIASKPIAVKVSPFLDKTQQLEFIDMLKKHKINFIIAINSLGNCLIIDKNKIAIKPKWGGYGGKGIKPVALGNIRIYYEEMKNRATIIGCGGIFNGQDAFEHILAGANLISIGSAFSIKGYSVFRDIGIELENKLGEYNYKSIKEAVGKTEEY